MTRPEPPPGADELLHCTTERTLLRSRDPSTGRWEVHKLLLRGSLADAEHESAIGMRVQGLDVVRHLGAGTHAATGRPSVRTLFHAGTSLDLLVGTRGALPAAEACATLLPAARTLAAMHAMRAADLPHGLCHGDVKPSNLLATETTTLLLDFEHAGPAQQGTCTGTRGFAGPEAGTSPLTPAFDVYGLGATLHWLLTGDVPRADRIGWRLGLHDAALQQLVGDCLRAAPALRPSCAEVAARLDELERRLRTEPLEPVRAALFACDLARAESLLAGRDDVDGAAVSVLRAALRRRQRLLLRRPNLPANVTAAPAGGAIEGTAGGPPEAIEPDRLADQLTLLRAWLRRFPTHAGAVEAVRSGRRLAGDVLARTLPSVFDLVRGEAFARAHARLHDLRRLAAAALSLPGPLRVPGDTAAHMPSLLQRSPLSCLQQEEQRLRAAETEHREVLAALQAAEASLALDDASIAVESIGSRYGGTSEAVARHRDRLHRFGFYLERVARARPHIERLHEFVPDEDPAPLLRFVAECANAVARSASPDDRGSGAIGLRSLQLALHNLREEFPAVRDRAAPGLECLDRALGKLTDEAWHLLAGAQQKLQAEPVPVRPLQLLLGRLDTFRAMEAFVDRPQHSRSGLIDRIEWLRLRLDQAQATRDRLARGAEQALAKGHWTTGLFDMERAVTHLENDVDADDRQAARLRQRLAEARKRKQEIEAALRRNHDLGARYAALQDDAASTTQERLQVLREQRGGLQFLVVHAHKERSHLYARDLREIELRIVEEETAQAETHLDLAVSTPERLRIATQTLAQLETFAGASESGAELPGRLSRLLDHWRRRQAGEQREHDRQQQEQRARSRRRWLAGAGGAALALAAATFQFWPASAAAARAHPMVAEVATLPESVRPAAATLLRAAASAEQAPEGDALTLLAAVEDAVRDYLGAIQDGSADPAITAFAEDVWSHALAVARTRADGTAAEFDSHTAAATARLVEAGLPR